MLKAGLWGQTMCVNYRITRKEEMEELLAELKQENSGWPPDDLFKDEVWQDYAAPIIIQGESGIEVISATYGMVPKRKMPPGAKHFSTMNARAETVGRLKSYKTAWAKGYRCLVPMMAFYEPCYESGKAERYAISMADGSPFAVAGIWRALEEEAGGHTFSFSQLTVYADGHPVMGWMHKPGDEKRSLVVVPPGDFTSWLSATDPEVARAYLHLPPVGSLLAEPAAKSYGR